MNKSRILAISSIMFLSLACKAEETATADASTRLETAIEKLQAEVKEHKALTLAVAKHLSALTTASDNYNFLKLQQAELGIAYLKVSQARAEFFGLSVKDFESLGQFIDAKTNAYKKWRTAKRELYAKRIALFGAKSFFGWHGTADLIDKLKQRQ